MREEFITGNKQEIKEKKLKLYITFDSSFISVGIHGRQDMNSCAVNQPGYGVIFGIVSAKVINKVKKHLSANHFVSMHICHIFEFRFTFNKTNQ